MSNSQNRQAPTDSKDYNWPGGNEALTGNEHVYVGFHGLFCFGYNHTSKLCEVGTHSNTRDHKFQLLVFEFDSGKAPFPRLIYSFEPDSYESAGRAIKLEIEEAKVPGISFFLPDFPQDGTWREVIDFEKLYGQVLKKKKGVQRPKITIDNAGFFVTPTDYQFQLFTDERHPKLVADLGRISFISFGAVTQLREEEGHISIKTDQHYVRIPRSKDKKLFIFFSNSCPQTVCDPPRSDFQEYYKMFVKPPGTKKFKLVKKDSSKEENPWAQRLTFLNSFFGKDGVLVNLLSSQESPCGTTGFGQGGGGTEEPPA